MTEHKKTAQTQKLPASLFPSIVRGIDPILLNIIIPSWIDTLTPEIQDMISDNDQLMLGLRIAIYAEGQTEQKLKSFLGLEILKDDSDDEKPN